MFKFIKLITLNLFILLFLFFLFESKEENFLNDLKVVKCLDSYDYNDSIDSLKTIKFGKYKNKKGEDKSIEWVPVIRDEEKKEVMLLSKYILSAKYYNESGDNCTWEDSSLREYLNSDFYEYSFREEEKEYIKTTVNQNYDNVYNEYEMSGGNDTEDKVFCLSIEDIKRVLKTDEVDYLELKILSAKTLKDYDSSENEVLVFDDYSFYWLRTPGHYQNTASVIDPDGSINYYGYPVDSKGFGVRPVIWVKYN